MGKLAIVAGIVLAVVAASPAGAQDDGGSDPSGSNSHACPIFHWYVKNPTDPARREMHVHIHEWCIP